MILPLVSGGIASSFVFSFLLSFNEYARAYYLVGRQNTLPLTMFGAMNSGASPTIYALSGAILVVSFGIVGVLLIIGRWRLNEFERARTVVQADPRELRGAAFADQYGR